MHGNDGGKNESDAKATDKAKTIWSEAVERLIHDLKHASPLKKSSIVICGSSVALLGLIIGGLIYNNTDKPKVVVILVAIALTGLVWGGALWLIHYLGPPSQSGEPTTQPAATRLLTLKDLFDTDFTSGSFYNEISLTYGDGTKRLIPYRVVTDFPARIKYLALYVPDSPVAFAQCQFLAANLQMPFDAIDKSVEMEMYDPSGMSRTTSKDLIFTGRVFLYYESNFSLGELAALEALFTEHKAAVEFRGHSYLVLHWHENRVLPSDPPSTDPAKKITQFTIPTTTQPAASRPATTKPSLSRNNPGRSFRVTHGQVGKWPLGTIFTEYEFRRDNPPRTPHPGEDPTTAVNDYYDELLDRLMNMTPPRIQVV